MTDELKQIFKHTKQRLFNKSKSFDSRPKEQKRGSGKDPPIINYQGNFRNSLRCDFDNGLEKELTDVLTDKERCKLFEDFLKRRHCEENLYFWMEVELFQNEKATPDDQLKHQGMRATFN